MRRNLRGIVTPACPVGGGVRAWTRLPPARDEDPAAFRFEPTATTDSFADQGWWQIYQDPTLQALIREALVNNLDVRIAAARIDQARAVLAQPVCSSCRRLRFSAEAQRARTSADQRIPGVPPIRKCVFGRRQPFLRIRFLGQVPARY